MLKRNKKLREAFKKIYLAMSEEEKLEFTSELMFQAYNRIPGRLNMIFRDLEIQRLSREADELIAGLAASEAQLLALRSAMTPQLGETK